MVKYQGLFKQPFILFPITFLLVFFLSFPWVNAQNVTKPKPQQWHINGILAALDGSYSLSPKKSNQEVTGMGGFFIPRRA